MAGQVVIDALIEGPHRAIVESKHRVKCGNERHGVAQANHVSVSILTNGYYGITSGAESTDYAIAESLSARYSSITWVDGDDVAREAHLSGDGDCPQGDHEYSPPNLTRGTAQNLASKFSEAETVLLGITFPDDPDISGWGNPPGGGSGYVKKTFDDCPTSLYQYVNYYGGALTPGDYDHAVIDGYSAYPVQGYDPNLLFQSSSGWQIPIVGFAQWELYFQYLSCWIGKLKHYGSSPQHYSMVRCVQCAGESIGDMWDGLHFTHLYSGWSHPVGGVAVLPVPYINSYEEISSHPFPLQSVSDVAVKGDFIGCIFGWDYGSWYDYYSDFYG